MTKEHILHQIRRTAEANGGVPLGRERFLTETGIRESDWHGRYWARWGDAVTEAGFSPNALIKPRDKQDMLDQLVAFVRELQHFPVSAELKMKRRADSTFPSAKTFNKFGSKASLIAAVSECARRQGHHDVVGICDALRDTASRREVAGGKPTGYVYLVKHGSRRHFKIGRTNNPLRREGEVSVELPEALAPIHVIGTDDPSGIEAYWHRRFAAKRLKNEWFALTAEDVTAFRRWRKIF